MRSCRFSSSVATAWSAPDDAIAATLSRVRVVAMTLAPTSLAIAMAPRPALELAAGMRTKSSRDTSSDRVDDADRLGSDQRRQVGQRVVLPLEMEDVCPVEHERTDLDPHLTGPGAGMSMVSIFRTCVDTGIGVPIVDATTGLSEAARPIARSSARLRLRQVVDPSRLQTASTTSPAPAAFICARVWYPACSRRSITRLPTPAAEASRARSVPVKRCTRRSWGRVGVASTWGPFMGWISLNEGGRARTPGR
jgi:hypothetical protein